MMIASSSDDQTVKLWDTESGQLLDTLQGHTKNVWSVAFSPAAASEQVVMLASASSDETIRVWNLETRACIKVLRSDRPYVGMNIYKAVGLTVAQRATLKALGAIEIAAVSDII